MVIGAARTAAHRAWRSAPSGLTSCTAYSSVDRTKAVSLITIIGRRHSGTRAMSHTLSASGVYIVDAEWVW